MESPSPSIKRVNALLAPHGLKILDRADACKGHYCIRRYIPGTNNKYVEHWNENKGGHWNAFGTVFTDIRQAFGQACLIIGDQNNAGLAATDTTNTTTSEKQIKEEPNCSPAYTQKTCEDLEFKAKMLYEALPSTPAHVVVTEILHICPRAYCVGRAAPHAAVFAVPPVDRVQQPTPKESLEPSVAVRNASVAKFDVQVGAWYSLAYIADSDENGAMHVIAAL